MANVLSLALKINADASGLNLTPVERALKRLGDETAKVTGVFDQFAASTEAAARAQEESQKAFDALVAARQAGTVSAPEFAKQFQELADAAREQAAAFAEGQRVTEANRTEEEKRAIAVEKLNRLLDAGAIEQDTYNRAIAEASGANAEAARVAAEAARQQADAAKAQSEALRQRQALEARAAQIINSNLTAQERFEQQLRELNELQRQGVLVGENYNRAVAAARKPLEDSAAAAEKAANANEKSTLQFNELSGIFAALPGPLGNIAGRISGLASAGEGLSRIFAGGLAQGFTNVAASVTALVNPLTLALAGIAAFAAGATAVARGLVDLEDRVERLGRLANQLGVSFEFVQVLEEAGNRADVSIEQLSGSFARLQNTLAGADEESKKAAAALERLGVSTQEYAELSEDDRISLIGERLAAIEDPAERSAAAISLFGRSGVQLLPFFNELELAATDMERFGRAVTDLDRQRLADFGGGLDALSLSASGLGTSLLLPFTGLAEGISFALAEITAGITAIVDPIGRILEPLLTQIGRSIEFLGTQLGNVGRVIGAVFEPFAVIVQEVFVALEPLLDGILDFLKSISDAAVTTTEWLISFTPVGAIAENVGVLGETISRVVNIITTAFQRVGEFIGALVAQFGELIAQSPFLQTLGNIISSVFGSVASVFSTIANAIGGVVGRLLTIAENFLGIDRSAQQAAEATQNLGNDIEELTEEERKQAAEREKFLQGFTDNVSKAIDQSAEFGQAGFDAALQYQNSITELQRQFDQGIINEESFKRAAEQANQAYEDQIDTIRRATEETERKAQAEADAVQSIIDANLEQIRIDEQFGGDSNRAKAADNLLKIQQEQARVEEQLQAARAAGDAEAINALSGRLATLDQVAARERDIASGAAKQREEAAKAAEDAAKEAERIAQQRARDLERVNEQILDKQAEFAARQFEIELERAQELATVRSGSIEINDIREGGIGAFFDTLQEDPAIAEAKRQTKELEKVRKEIAKLNAEKVDILAGTG